MTTQESQDTSKSDDTKPQTSPYPPRMIQANLRPALLGDEMYLSLTDNLEEHVEKLKTMEIRSDDILLYTFPRSGTHWVFRILDMLVLGRAEFRDVHVDQVQYDFQLPEDLDKIPSPRVLHSHLSLKFQPPQILKKPKIVHLYRNPKAVIVSVYHGMKELDHFKALANIESAIAIVMHNWPIFMNGIGELMRGNPELQIYHVAYEDMISNLFETVKNLAAFLGITASDDLCRQIEEACTFDAQKVAESKMNIQANINFGFYRKGDKENWKEHLTVAQSEAIDDMLRQRKDVCRFSAKYI